MFPVLEARGIPRDGGPIGVMLYEHQIARKLTRDMHDALANARADGTAAPESFRQAARSYIDLLTNHIFKEDNILFRIAQAMLTPATGGAATPDQEKSETIEIRSPVSGHILRIYQESEAIVAAGAPILEVGDPHDDLEVVAELLSSDAVKVSRGDRVIIDKWGGAEALSGKVERIEPLGFTKVSALGVEEQRVNTIIDFEKRNDDERLGDGYRVEARIVIWEDANALRVPASALFRVDGEWAVFRVEAGRARQAVIKIGRNNGVDAEVLEGLEEGDAVILFPGGAIEDGALVTATARG